MTEKTIIELQAEIDRLRLHSGDLLTERKTEKQRRDEAESALAALTIERDGLLTRLDDVTLTGPVERALERVTAAPPKQGRRLLEEAGIQFKIGAHGDAVAVDGELEIPLPDLYRHLNKKCDTSEGLTQFGWILRSSGITGGGAIGGSGAIQPASNPVPTQAPAQSFGLR